MSHFIELCIIIIGSIIINWLLGNFFDSRNFLLLKIDSGISFEYVQYNIYYIYNTYSSVIFNGNIFNRNIFIINNIFQYYWYSEYYKGKNTDFTEKKYFSSRILIYKKHRHRGKKIRWRTQVNESKKNDGLYARDYSRVTMCAVKK